MASKTRPMALEPVMEMFTGQVNSVSVCRDKSLSIDNFYTVHSIHNHEIAKVIIQIFEDCKYGRESIEYLGGDADKLLLVFRYSKPRPITDFFMGDERSLTECEDIIKGVIAECISTKLPFPFLYQVISQRKINLSQDGSVMFDMSIDLASIDPGITERDCARALAELVRDLLAEQKNVDALSLQLIRSKLYRGSYDKFRELYVDVALAAKPKQRLKLRERWQRFWMLYGNIFFRVGLVLAIIAMIVALIMLISNLATSGVPLFRLFSNSFKKIGTESLVMLGSMR